MEQSEALTKLRNIIRHNDDIVFFGGAGVSTESDIPDFRSASGLYKQNPGGDDEFSLYSPEEILHINFFKKQTRLFFKYYFTKMIYPEAKPNGAHIALAEMEADGRLSAVVTQNIDGLHQQAGSTRVFELHGSVHRNFCMECGASYTLGDILKTAPEIPLCGCGGTIKPDVVLYGETLKNDVIENAVRYIRKASVLIVGGTSLSVYPAAGLLSYFKGGTLVLINRDETPYDNQADLIIRDKIGAVLSECT